ncbi:TVP38/TMEM64 family protein [filamentous cyanobacterium CCP2]|nr:TVP38/TMEM64 family protein [filamentous cyanobacterium CCP2]
MNILKLAQSKVFYLVLGAIVLSFVLDWVPVRLLLDLEALMLHINMQACSVCTFILAQVLATVIGLPGTLLVIAGGAIYGLVWGTVWSTVGATLGAIVAFCLTRYLLRNRVEKRFGHHKLMRRLCQITHRNAFSCVLAIRIVPISPFNLVNFLLGLTPIGLKPYALGTLIGIIPGTMAYTGLGISGRKALAGEGMGHLSIALCALVLLSLLPSCLKRMRCN